MSWPKASEEKMKLLAGEMRKWDATRKNMFGSVAYFTNGNMFIGVFGDSVFLRLSDADRGKLKEAHPDAKTFEPQKGRLMREYMVLPDALVGDSETLRVWIRRAFDNANSVNPNRKN